MVSIRVEPKPSENRLPIEVRLIAIYELFTAAPAPILLIGALMTDLFQVWVMILVTFIAVIRIVIVIGLLRRRRWSWQGEIYIQPVKLIVIWFFIYSTEWLPKYDPIMTVTLGVLQALMIILLFHTRRVKNIYLET